MSAQKPARKHHFVPRFLLEGWVKADGALEVYDLEKREWRRANPKSVAFETDLYCVNLDDVPVDHIETTVMTPIDGRVSGVIGAFREGRPMEAGAAYVLRVLVVTMALRSPRMRDAITEELRDLGREMIADLVSVADDDTLWSERIAYWREQNVATTVDELEGRRDDLRATIDISQWQIEPDPTQVVQRLAAMTKHAATPGLIDEFAVLIAEIPESAPERFVISDSPAVYIQDPTRQPREAPYPSIDGAHALFLPIGPRHAVLLEHRATSLDPDAKILPPEEIARVSPDHVLLPEMNHAAAEGAMRHIFSVDRDPVLPDRVSLGTLARYDAGTPAPNRYDKVPRTRCISVRMAGVSGTGEPPTGKGCRCRGRVAAC